LSFWGRAWPGRPATAAEAERLVIERLPDVALVDFHLRGGEQSYSLVARLLEQGVHVIMLSGSFEFPPPSSVAGATMLEKPFSESQLLAYLSPIAKRLRA
jgi:hypothetical protein